MAETGASPLPSSSPARTPLARAEQFVWLTARVLEQRRFAYHFLEGSADAVDAASISETVAKCSSIRCRNRVRSSQPAYLVAGMIMPALIFVGVNLIHKEVDRRTVQTILSKPLSRAEFLLGKFLGLALTIWMQMAVMVAVFAAVSLATGAPLGKAHAAAFLLSAVELALVVAVATFFSAFTSPMLASFFAVGVWVAGNLTRNLRDIGASSELPLVVLTTRWLHRALPDLASFNLTLEAAHGLPVTGSDVWLALAYGTGYAVVVLVAAVAVFERRDFR